MLSYRRSDIFLLWSYSTENWILGVDTVRSTDRYRQGGTDLPTRQLYNRIEISPGWVGFTKAWPTPSFHTRSPHITDPLGMVGLPALMKATSGSHDVIIGLIDGPVSVTHPAFAESNIREIPGLIPGTCTRTNSIACAHGTFVAGILVAKRDADAPAICPGCKLVARPIFSENGNIPNATSADLSRAIVDCIKAGARIINMSAALAQPSSNNQQELTRALDYASKHGAIVVAASGNQGTLGTTVITRHPWAVPVVACDLRGYPTNQSNLGGSIARLGLMAPGDQIRSLGADGKTRIFSGTSAATPFVTGVMALLWSIFPNASAAQIKRAVTQSSNQRPHTVVPPRLDAGMAYRAMKIHARGWVP